MILSESEKNRIKGLYGLINEEGIFSKISRYDPSDCKKSVIFFNESILKNRHSSEKVYKMVLNQIDSNPHTNATAMMSLMTNLCMDVTHLTTIIDNGIEIDKKVFQNSYELIKKIDYKITGRLRKTVTNVIYLINSFNELYEKL